MDDTQEPEDRLDDQPSAVDGAIRAAFDSQEIAAGNSILAELPADIPRVLLRDVPDEKSPLLGPVAPEDRLAASRYQTVGEIARGGVGAIYKVRDTDLGRDVAWKVLQRRHAGRADLVQRFVEEAQIGGQLQHPGIVPVYDLGMQADRRPYISMKLVKGTTLSQLLSDRSEPQEDRERFLRLFGKVLETMAYAHARGVIHRDLKPANVMVGSFGEVQIVDWGFAKVLGRGGIEDERRATREHKEMTIVETVRSGSEGSESMAGSVFGTPAYMPPEQALGQIDRLDERADVFALGSILCEILTGAPAYVEADERLVVLAARGVTADAFRRLDRCGAAPDLIQLTKHCLSADRKGRPADAGQLDRLFAGVLERREQRRRAGEIETAQAHARAEEALRSRRKTRIVAAAACAALVLAGLGLHWAQRSNEERERQTTRLVGEALDEASRLGLEARGAPTFRADTWGQALEAAQRAVDLAAREGAEPSTRQRAQRRLAELEAARAATRRKAERSEAESRLRRAVTTYRIRAHSVKVYGAERVRSDFIDALKDYGIDLDTGTPEAIVGALADSDAPRDVRLALDYLRINLPRDTDRRAKLDLVLARADGDPWRARLRAVTGDAEATLKVLRASDPTQLPTEDVQLLVHAVQAAAKSGPTPEPALREAARFVRRSQEVRAEDGWLAMSLIEVGLAGPEEGAGEGYWEVIEDACTTAREKIGDDPLMRFVLALSRMNTGKVREGLDVLRALHTEREDMPFIAQSLATNLTWHASQLVEQGQVTEALRHAKEATRTYPEHARAWELLGRIHAADGNFDLAFKAWDEALRLEPDDFGLHEAIRRPWYMAAQKRNDPRYWKRGEALARRMLALAETPQQEGRAHGVLADFLCALGEYDAACTEYALASALPSGVSNLSFLYGRALYGATRYAEAIQQFRTGIERARPDLEDPAKAQEARNLLRNLYEWHAQALWAVGSSEETLEDARGLIEIGPDDVECMGKAAFLFLRAEQFRDALAASDRAAELMKQQGLQGTADHQDMRARILHGLAELDESAELYRQASEAYRRVREKDEDGAYFNAHGMQIAMLLHAGELGEARRELARLLASDAQRSRTAGLWMVLSATERLGLDSIRVDVSRAALKDSTVQGKFRVRVLTQLAMVLAASPDLSVRNADEAVRFAEEAVALAERDGARVQARCALAAAHCRAGDYEESLRALAGIESDSMTYTVQFHQVLAHWHLGQAEKARELFRKYDGNRGTVDETKHGRMEQAVRDEAAALLGVK